MPDDTVEQTPVPSGELGSTETETEGSTPGSDEGDLYSRPDFRAYQSKSESTHAKQLNEARNEAAELRRQLEDRNLTVQQAEARARAIDAALDQLGAGPEAKVMVQKMARLEELEAKEKAYQEREWKAEEARQRQAAQDAWRGKREDYARRKGVDPNDPVFQQALRDALDMQDESPVFEAIDELRNKKSAGQKSEETREQEPPRQRPQPGVPPPSGGGSRSGSAAEKQRLQERFEAEIKGARSSNEKVQIRRKYRQMGLQI